MTKLAVFFQMPPELGTEATELVRNSKIQYVKAIDPDWWATPARDMFPNQKVLGRPFILGGDGAEGVYVAQGAVGAEHYVSFLYARYTKMKAQGVWGILGPNEQHPQTVEELTTHNLFWAKWARLVGALGFTPWILSAGVGWPYDAHVPYFKEATRVAVLYGGGVELHEYGAPSVLDGEGDWSLRYRRFMERIGVATPIFLGECGIDGGVTPAPVGKKQRRGWKDWTDWVYTDNLYGLPPQNMNEELYWRQVVGYDEELMKDNCVIAATPYVTIPAKQWKSFDWGGEFIRRMVKRWEEEAVPSVTPEPLPEDETCTDAPTLADKCRWYTEEAIRQLETGDKDRAMRILYSLVRLDGVGLMYRLENILKEH